MKKITMIVLSKERENFLNLLRKEGVVHIKSLSKPSSQDITSVDEKMLCVKKAISILRDMDANGEAITMEDSLLTDRAKQIVEKQDLIEELEKKIKDIRDSLVFYKPWGGFNPGDLAFLKEHGINVRLYVLSKSEFKKAEAEENIYVVDKQEGHFYIAGLFHGDEKGLPFTEVKPPQESLGQLENRLNNYNKEIEDAKNFIKGEVELKQGLKGLTGRLEKRHRFLEVLHGMKHEDGFSLIQGFCPVREINRVISLAKRYDIGYLITEIDDPSEAPTLVENPVWLRVIEPVFRFINTVPGYSEFDISPVFLVFFSIFFAFIVGDAGYGLLFSAAAWFIRKKLKNLPPEPFRLMYVLSFTTVVWGAITGTWFGFEKIAQLPILNSLIIDKINSFTAGNEGYLIYICFVIGVIHLSIAHVMKFLRTINSIQSAAQLGWVSILWGLFFLAGTLVVNRPFPYFAKYFLMVGVLLVLVFSNFQKNIVKGILISLRDVPLGIAGAFGDIVSYLRLFAVGSASVAVASSFNSMAMDIGFGSVISGFFAALILFLAHALNITLSFLAVIVHGVRLNMLEFSGHLGMEWSGNRYMPFAE